MTISTIRLEEEIQILGSEIFHDLKRQRPSLLDAQRYTELFLSLGMQDEALKVSLFRFVDVLPTLPDAASVIRHVQEYFGPVRDRIPEPFRLALSLSPTSLTARPAAATRQSSTCGMCVWCADVNIARTRPGDNGSNGTQSPRPGFPAATAVSRPCQLPPRPA